MLFLVVEVGTALPKPWLGFTTSFVVPKKPENGSVCCSALAKSLKEELHLGAVPHFPSFASPPVSFPPSQYFI